MILNQVVKLFAHKITRVYSTLLCGLTSLFYYACQYIICINKQWET